jgi:hypothetical protein
VVFGIRLPRALSSSFIQQALRASDGVAGLSSAMRGTLPSLLAPRCPRHVQKLRRTHNLPALMNSS